MFRENTKVVHRRQTQYYQ